MTSPPPEATAEDPSLRYPQIPFHGILEAAADRFGERVALLYEDRRISFRELDDIANAFAQALRERGVERGDRIALYAANCPEWIAALYGIHKAGASAVLVSSALKRREVQHAVDLSSPRCFVTDRVGAEVVEALGLSEAGICLDDPAPENWSSFGELVASHPKQRLELAIDPDDTEAALFFSSGTTGLPKAVRHLHRSLVVGGLQWRAALGMEAADRLQTFTPLSHILGAANVAAGITSGATHRLFQRFHVDAVVESLERDRISIGIAVAPVALALADHPELEERDLSALRFFCWCATPVVPEIAQRFTRRSGVEMIPAYGTTEAPVLSMAPVHRPEQWRLDSAGLPAADVEIRIVDLETQRTLPAGESGEVVVRSPNQMTGYLPEAANHDAFLPGGWYRTGDVGWLEEAGWLHLTDRLKEMIKVSGFQVAPAEIEAVLLAHPAVSDCAVFAVPDARRGQLPRAAVALRAGQEVSEAELIDFTAEQLANYKRLCGIDFCDSVPRTPSGKALRRVLTARYTPREEGSSAADATPRSERKRQASEARRVPAGGSH